MTHVIFLGAKYSKNNSFNVTVAILDANTGREVSTRKGDCELICTWADMYDKIELLTRDAAKSLATGGGVPSQATSIPPTSESPAAAASPPRQVTAPQAADPLLIGERRPGPAASSSTRGWLLIGGGSAALGLGAWLWSRDESLTSCQQANDPSTCRHEWNTALPSGLLVAAGGLAIIGGVGDLLGWWSPKEKLTSTRLLVGPTSFALAGGF